MTDAILLELLRRDTLKRRIVDAMHPRAQEFVLEPGKRSAARSGRRGGKSTAAAGKFALTAIDNPGEMSVFIAISVAQANEIIARAFSILGMKTGFAAHQITKSGQVYWLFPNGHRVWIAGCKNRSEAEKFRGEPYCGVVIDECDSMRGHLQYLCEDVLEWALMDLNGWMALTGTPGVTPVGYFYELTTGSNGMQQWPTYHWNCLDNPFLPNARKWLEDRKAKLGIDESSPTFKREFLGEWVHDTDSLVYSYDATRNADYSTVDVTDDELRWVIGIDLGVVDATAFVAGCYRPGVPDLHVVESQSWSGLSPSRAAVYLQQWRLRYPRSRVVADLGGQGKAFAAEWIDRFGIAVEPAQKLDMVGQVAFINGMLRSGQVKIHLPGCRSLATQVSELPWNEDRDAHESSYADHEADAFRYCVLAMRPNYKAVIEEPRIGSPEHLAAMAKAEKERVIAESMRRRRPR